MEDKSMKRAADLTKRALYRAAWKFIPMEKKYAILWARTKRTWPQSGLSPRPYQRTDTLVSG